jgi:hydroxymethylpyrimidine kinase / phosphomethylpyrimidine kinase / thiamine-phosphate diphosphorylase
MPEAHASHRPPVVWSIAGLDTAGGAGLSADQRAADAFGVHLCPVAACLTAQHSQGVNELLPVSELALDSQLQALCDDLPPRVIKTGLLGSVAAVVAVARWVDRLRATLPVPPALVVDPVLKASAGGAGFSNEAIVQAYRQWLVPRATVLTPNRAEALALLGRTADDTSAAHELAQALCALGARAVLCTGGDGSGLAQADAQLSVDWLHTPHAQGWLVHPRVPTPHHHGSGCTLATGVAAALALGHVEADACVLGKMLTHHALTHHRLAGQGAGPVVAQTGFAAGPAQGGAPLPWLGLGTALPWAMEGASGTPLFRPYTAPTNGLYGIVATGEQVQWALEASVRCVQLRHKATEGFRPHLAHALAAAEQAAGAPTGEGPVQLFVNDHWQAALQALPTCSPTPEPCPAHHIGLRLGLHLGQEDLLALTPDDQQHLLAARAQVMLGLSSHSLWELARAAGCGASYIACGPVQPTTTKDMPWRPQGAHNLAWWVAHSPVPVVGIGGLLTRQDLSAVAEAGAAALCVVRALTDAPPPWQERVKALADAISQGKTSTTMREMPLPHPVL